MHSKKRNIGCIFNYQTSIDKLYAGTDLTLDEKGCLYGSNRVLLFSSSFKNDIIKWKEKDYIPYSAKVNTVLYWKKKEDDNLKSDDPNIGKETKIVLPIVYLKKQ